MEDWFKSEATSHPVAYESEAKRPKSILKNSIKMRQIG